MRRGLPLVICLLICLIGQICLMISSFTYHIYSGLASLAPDPQRTRPGRPYRRPKVGRGEERLGRVALLEDAVGGALAFAEQQQEDLEGLIKILKAAQVKPCPI